MSKDYAKRSIKRKKSKNKKNKLWLWLAILILTISLVILGFNNIDRIISKKNHSPLKKTPVIKSKIAITPKFDFYNISVQKNKENQNKTAKQYKLEIAIVNSFAEADRIKAELALQGFAAHITPIYQQNTQKYYVSVGPYDSEDTANIIQKKLRLNKIKSKLEKIR